MRVIFLDIDGVLNSEAFYWRRENGNVVVHGERPACEIDPLAVESFAKLVERSQAKIVVSSAWRIAYGLEEICEAIDPDGRYPSITHNIIDKTVNRVPMEDRPTAWQEKDYERGFEIASWIVCNTVAQRGFTMNAGYPDDAPDPDKVLDGYVIIDDSDDMAWLGDHLVQTSWGRGFLPEHVDRCLEVLAMPVGKVWP